MHHRPRLRLTGCWLGLVLGLLIAPAQAQHSSVPDTAAVAQTVVVDYSVTLQNRTPEEAQQMALNRARAEAVRKVVGTQVQAERSSATIETDDGVQSRYAQIVRTGAGGRVVAQRLLEDGIDTRPEPDVYRVRLEATVQPDVGRPDPGFGASLDLTDDDRVFVARSPRTRSDELIASIRVTKNAHLTLFSITRDTIQVLWPNAFMKDTFVPAQTKVEFPSATWRERGVHLRADVPSGRERITERLLLVATKSRVPFEPVPAAEVQDGTLTTVDASLLALNRWLVNIPLDQRATATVTYDVRRERP